MLRYTVMILLAACAANQRVKDYYDEVERGSTWLLGLGQPTRDSGIADDCPIFAAKTATIPSGAVTGSEVGCTATLAFTIEDDGDVTSDWNSFADFEQKCNDGSQLSCNDGPVAPSLSMICTLVNMQSALAGDCHYMATLVRVD